MSTPKAWRRKRRYLLLRWQGEEPLDEIRRIMGEIAWANAGVHVVEKGENYAIVRVNVPLDKLFRAAVALVHGGPAWVELASGTLRRLRRKAGMVVDRRRVR